MTPSPRHLLACVTACVAVWLPSSHPVGAQPAPGVVVVTPQPVGAARLLVAGRGTEVGGVPELPLEDLVAAEPAPESTVATRGAGAETPPGGPEQPARMLPVEQVTLPTPPGAVTSRRADAVYKPAVMPQGWPAQQPVQQPQPVDPAVPPAQPLSAEDAKARFDLELVARVYDQLQASAQQLEQMRKEREERRRAEREAAKDVRGPSALGAINLLEGLHVSRGVGLYQSDVLEIDHQVYQDANPKTGLFYYVPKRYDLAWDPESQYAMTVIYGMAGQEAAEGEVYMAARLSAGVGTRELQVARQLLHAYIRRHAREDVIPFKDLRPLPLARTSNVALFGGAHSDFTVASDKISVQGVSGLLSMMDLSWATDVRRLLNLESLLRTDAGIHGNVTFSAAGEEEFARSVPLDIAIATPDTFGRVVFDRRTGWTNRTFYPIQLGRLHVLLINPARGGGIRKDEPVVYTWDLGGPVVMPGAHVRWDAQWVPAWVDTHALVAWVEYAVDADCGSCDDRVLSAKFIPPAPATREVVFTTGDLFEATGAYRVSVHLRSPFLEPQRSRVLEPPPVVLTEDGTEYTIARLFLKDREFTGEGAHQPFYEYRVEITMGDGRTFASPRWIPSRELDRLLGSANLEEIVGGVPGAEDPEPAS